MKIKAFLSMKDDFERLDFTLTNFCKYNPDIPILVANDGGKDPSSITSKFPNVSIINFDKCSWIGNSGSGSFGPLWFDRLFEFALSDLNFTHLLFLETDVYTRKRISTVPQYDMAGFMNCSGPGVQRAIYDIFKLGDLGYKWDKMGGSTAFLHTGCGGTIYTKEFFIKSKPNLDRIKQLYVTDQQWCFQDVLITILGIISGCSIGSWPEVTQRTTPCFELLGYDPNSAMIHNWKV